MGKNPVCSVRFKGTKTVFTNYERRHIVSSNQHISDNIPMTLGRYRKLVYSFWERLLCYNPYP